MSIDILVPQLPESVSDATLITWHKQVGDFVVKNENLVDLETDKVVLEVPAPESGVLTQILKEDGSIVTGGVILAVLDVQADQKPASTHTSTEQSKATDFNGDDIPLSPSVRRLIHENAMDPSIIKGTGKNGIIILWEHYHM